MTSGGKRKGAGRPLGSKAKTYKGWIKLGVTVSPEMNAYLKIMKAKGFFKSHVVDEALRNHERGLSAE